MANNDVNGKALVQSGRSKFPARFVGSSCSEWDGVKYLTVSGLVGTETVVSSGGTTTPSISAGRIDFTAGTCWNLLLSDGTRLTFAEEAGSTAYDVSGNGNHGIWSGTPAYTRQDEFHWNICNGWGDAVNDLVDGDMEAAGTSAYNALDATLSKVPSSLTGSTQALRVTATGATYWATQNILTVWYRLQLYVELPRTKQRLLRPTC